MRAGTTARCLAKRVAFGNRHHAAAGTDANRARPVPDHVGARSDYDQPFVDNDDEHHGEFGPIWSDFLLVERGSDPHADFQPRRHTGGNTREETVSNTNTNQYHPDERPIRGSDSDS